MDGLKWPYLEEKTLFRALNCLSIITRLKDFHNKMGKQKLNLEQKSRYAQILYYLPSDVCRYCKKKIRTMEKHILHFKKIDSNCPYLTNL